MRTHVLTFALSAAMLLAQQPAVDAADGRRLLLLDAKAFVPPRRSGPDLVSEPAAPKDDAPEAVTTEAPQPDVLLGIAAFVRHFATPALGPGDDVQPLGGRWLAVLAPPEKCAAVEQMLRTATQRRDELLVLDVQLMQLPKAVYARLVQPMFPKDSTPEQRRLLLLSGDTGKFVDAVKASEAEHMSAPTVCVRPLSEANVSVVQNHAYVRDYTVVQKDGKAIADPVVDVARDGVEVSFLASYVDHGNVAIDCKVTQHKLQLPMLESKVDIGLAAPVIVQLPRVTTVRLSQKAALPLGHSLLLSSPRADGSWLCALVRVAPQQ